MIYNPMGLSVRLCILNVLPCRDIMAVFIVPGNVTVIIGGVPRIGGGHDGIKIDLKKILFNTLDTPLKMPTHRKCEYHKHNGFSSIRSSFRSHSVNPGRYILIANN